MADTIYDSLSDSQKELISKHLELVLEANKETNLTRIDSIESGTVLHVEDSLSALPEINQAPAGKYIDLGSGGGFPGIPIAVATGRKTTLLDARHKKVDLLNEFAQELGIDKQVHAEHARIEEFSRKHLSQYSVATARALAKLSVIMEFASPLLKISGRLVCYKARIEEDELKHAKKIANQLGMRFESKRDFVLSDGETQRCIIVFEKVSKPKIKLPRHDGFAQKKPL